MVAVDTPLTVSVNEALFPAASEATSVWTPADSVVGIANCPLAAPLPFVVTVPRVAGDVLWSTIVKVSLPHVPEMAIVIVPPKPTGFGVSVMVTVQVTGP
jgi:hypothetical protein